VVSEFEQRKKKKGPEEEGREPRSYIDEIKKGGGKPVRRIN